MTKKSRTQVRRENYSSGKPAITLTKIGVRYLSEKSRLSQEEIAGYPGTLEQLCTKYELVRGEHFIVESQEKFDFVPFNTPIKKY